MKRLVLFVLCFALFCCSALSFTCSAADDLSDEGYLWDSEGGFWYLPKSEAADLETTTRRSGPLRAPAASGTGTTIAFPDFDKNKIDVAGFPDYVQKVLSSNTSLVWLIVTSNRFYLWVADGCIPVISTTNGNLFLMNLSRSNSSFNDVSKFFYPDGKSYFSRVPESFICYSATYSWSSNDTLYSFMTSQWAVANSKTFVRYYSTDTPSPDGCVFYNYNIPGSLASVDSDFFVFGSSNNYFRTDKDSLAFPIKNGNFSYYSGDNAKYWNSFNKAIPVYNSSSKFYLIYSGSFPTAQSQQNEIQRGILGQLKALPEKIKAFFDSLFTKIKGLFIPSDGFFDTYFSDLKTFFAERFGFIYDLPAAVITILNKLINYTPAESGYHIHFPEVSAPVIMEGISGVGWQRIIPEQDYYFDFLDKAPFSTLYSGYRAFVWLAYCFMLVNLAKSKAENIFGGK